jgi:long-chain fatty acid transport protein
MQKAILAATIVSGLATLICASSPALATDGYFQNGYGMKSIGMGGTADALTEGGMNGASNPATASFADTQVDLGLYLFFPSRSASRTDNAFGLNGSAQSRGNIFEIPEFGSAYAINDRVTVGLTLYGNGGIATAYPSGEIPVGHCGPNAPASNLLCGPGKLGVSLNQFVIAPTLSYKISPTFSIGVAPQILVQQFTGYGLQAFAGFSAAPGNLTDRGFSYSYGGGVRVGAFWEPTPLIAFGLDYQTPIYATQFHSYTGLFAGPFDVPGNLSFGVALHPSSRLTLAADYERIFYGDIAAIANSPASMALLGTPNGPGFGWHSINVFKAGIEYALTPALTLRAGYNHSGNPISSSNVTFNILAPAVVEHQVSVGATYNVTHWTQLTVAYTHAFQNTLSGSTSPLLPGGGTDHITLTEDEVGLGLSIRF